MRWNVLFLMGAAYLVLTIFFVTICAHDEMTAVDAWDILQAPLMALIGGTLAISKDLIADDHDQLDPKINHNDIKDEETKTNKQSGNGENH